MRAPTSTRPATRPQRVEALCERDSRRTDSDGYVQDRAGAVQYTAVDDCTRIRVLALFNRRTAANSVQFLELAIEEFPFPIQRIQTDRGREFFAYCFQEKLMEYGIKFRPIKPASPHLKA